MLKGDLRSLKVCMNCKFLRRKSAFYFCVKGKVEKGLKEVHPLNKACKEFEWRAGDEISC